MARVSGLNDRQARYARSLLVKSAELMANHKSNIDYSQGSNRMEALRRHKTVTKNQYPATADCSSTVYWMLWDALKRPYGVRDVVCRCDWDPNGVIYTGTQYKNGKAVVHDKNLKIGDLIFYGDQGGGIPEHVAMYIGGGKVFSHGSMGGPYILGLDYRSDRRMSRRYI